MNSLSRALQLSRYQDDPTPPPFRSALRDLGVRAIVPSILNFLAICAVGWVIMNPLGQLETEDQLNARVQELRSGWWDAVTNASSRMGDTWTVIAICAAVMAVVFIVTRQWWFAVIPGIAIALQASVFVAATHTVGRSRPDVPHLDAAPPTSSFPSGHVGASTAVYMSVLLMAQQIEQAWLRRLISGVCVLLAAGVAFSRVYRGMHHVSDMAVGVINGLVCAVVAWLWVRRERRRDGELSGAHACWPA